MTLKEQIMNLQTYKMYEGEDTVYVERDEVLKLLEQQPSREYISRFDVLNLFNYGKLDEDIVYSADVMNAVRALPAVTPKFTDTEIQKMQELEQAQLDKAYELGKAEMQPCEDCISREALMKLFKEYQPSLATRVCEFGDALEGLPSVTPETRWIPVSEALPPRDKSVLTYHRNESFDYQYVSWIDDYSGKWAGFIGNLSDEVLAWRPLPHPYKAAVQKQEEFFNFESSLVRGAEDEG